MKASETPLKLGTENDVNSKKKPQFRPAKDDTKPFLQDPILRSDPTETEEPVLRLPQLSPKKMNSQSQ